jgi:site-specific DNA-methyltransferase (adenine-specific)
MAAASVDMIFADPPYNLSGSGFLTCRSGRPEKCDKGVWDQVEDLHAFNRQWIAECVRVLKDEGTLWISGTLHNHPSIGMALKELGLWIINDIIWYKPNATPLLRTNRLAPATELIWVASKSKHYYTNCAARVHNSPLLKVPPADARGTKPIGSPCVQGEP